MCCRCERPPPYGTIRANPISGGINGRPIAVEKTQARGYFGSLALSQTRDVANSGGEAKRRRRKPTLPRLVRRDCILHDAGKSHRTRSVTKHTTLQVADSSEDSRTQTKRSCRGVRRQRARRLPGWEENTEANPELSFYISAPMSINIHIFQPLRNIQSCLKHAYSEMA